jgi:hypothetical protein
LYVVNDVSVSPHVEARFLAMVADIKIQARSALFWDITQRRVVILYRRFGTTYLSHLQGSRNPRRKPMKSKEKAFFSDFLTLGDGTDRLPRNVGTELPLYDA